MCHVNEIWKYLICTRVWTRMIKTITLGVQTIKNEEILMVIIIMMMIIVLIIIIIIIIIISPRPGNTGLIVSSHGERDPL